MNKWLTYAPIIYPVHTVVDAAFTTIYRGIVTSPNIGVCVRAFFFSLIIFSIEIINIRCLVLWVPDVKDEAGTILSFQDRKLGTNMSGHLIDNLSLSSAKPGILQSNTEK
jgi:hypothetical protein